MNNTRFYPFERNRYFYGKLLTVRDFETEQKYFNNKRRLINRLLFGSGVVCGLQVVAVDDKTISVETGAAIDSLGREIVVPSPVTQKLSMIEGFTNNEYTKSVYLCIAYDEKGKEPVHSVSGSSTRPEEISEHNRIQEGYRLFVREEAPDPSAFGFMNLVEETRLVYQDSQVRIWQKTPRYVNPGGAVSIAVKVEKALQTARVEFEYEVVSDHFYPLGGGESLKISFAEPEYSQGTEYEARFQLKAGDFAGTAGTISVKGGSVSLKLGDNHLSVPTECLNTVHIIEGPVKEKVLESYFNLSLDQCVEHVPDQYICLAKISLLHVGPTFIIEKVEKIPFGDYIYNTAMLYRLGILGEDGPVPEFSATASVELLEHDKSPAMIVDYNNDSSLFDFRLGIPRPRPLPMSMATGTVEIDLESRSGKSYFSDEVDHGLGPGPVLITLGLEEAGGNALEGIEEYSDQIFCGPSEVFQKSHWESSTPPVSMGSVAYPKKGTFRVGVRPQSGNIAKIRVRWWALKNL